MNQEGLVDQYSKTIEVPYRRDSRNSPGYAAPVERTHELTCTLDHHLTLGLRFGGVNAHVESIVSSKVGYAVKQLRRNRVGGVRRYSDPRPFRFALPHLTGLFGQSLQIDSRRCRVGPKHFSVCNTAQSALEQSVERRRRIRGVGDSRSAGLDRLRGTQKRGRP